MEKVASGTYRQDRLYPKVVWATAELLRESDEISAVAILMKIGNLTPQDHDAWRRMLGTSDGTSRKRRNRGSSNGR